MLTNTVSIVLNASMIESREVVVDDMSDVAHIDATACNTRSNENRLFATAESTKSSFALLLGAAAVRRGDRESLIEEEIIKIINLLDGIDEDDGSDSGKLCEQFNQKTASVVAVDLDDFLHDVAGCATGTAHANSNMLLRKVFPGDHSSFFREGSREETVLDVALVLLATLEDWVKLISPAFLEHLICLINDSVLEASECQDIRTVDEVPETTRSTNKNVTSFAEKVALFADGRTAIYHTWAKHGAIGELASLVEDLDSQLTSGHNDENQRLSLDRSVLLVGWARARSAPTLGFAHERVQDGDQVSSSLARTCAEYEQNTH